MTSNCWSCLFARGKNDGLVHSPGDTPGDAVFCTNVEFLNEAGYEVYKDPKYGYGSLVYRIEVLEGDPNLTCEAGVDA